MTNSEFYAKFSDETACRLHFKEERIKHGITCKSCECKKHYWLSKKQQFQCSNCRFRTTLRSGTLLENSNLPFAKWYEAFQLISQSKKPISAKTVERHLNVHYETAWFLLQKIRIAMGKRNAQYKLDGDIEVDEALMTVMDLSEEENASNESKKCGRGAAKAKVLVMAAFKTVEKTVKNKNTGQEYTKTYKVLKYAAMELIDDFKSVTLSKGLSKWIEKRSRIYADDFRSYKSIHDEFEDFVQRKSSGKLAAEHLPLVHKIIGNVKNAILGVHHSVSQLHLQNYLDEFCYKLNRRFLTNSLMERIAVQAVRFSW